MSGRTGQVAQPVSVTINGRTVQVPAGTLVVEAARQAGVPIPVFCYHPRLKPAGVCRMCLVKLQGQAKLVTACTTPVADGMTVDTLDPEVKAAQRSVLEFLLINHPLDCPVCDKGGECDLQDLTFKYGPGVSRLFDGKLRRPKAVQLGPSIVLDQERCILCRRCVRFDEEIAMEGQLVIRERAIASEVATVDGQPYDHYFTGNTVELCPVGALTSAPYRFRARPWDLSPVASRCTLCSVHCAVRLDFRMGELVRVVSPGALPEHVFGAQGLMQAYHTPADEVPGARGMGWLCDRGRFNYGYVHSPRRPTAPLSGRGPLKTARGWDAAIEEAAGALAEAVREAGPESVAVLGGGRLMAEEAYLLRRLADLLGTPHVDHRVGAQAVASLATPGGACGRVQELDFADAVVLVGTPVVERAPVLDLAVRAALARGVRLLAVGPVRPPYRGPVEFHAAVGREMAAALGRVAETLQSGGPRGRPGRVSVIWDGEGAWDGTAAAVGEAIVDLADGLERRGVAVNLLVPGAQAQSRAAEAAGLLPGPGSPGTAGILEAAASGRIRVLYVVAANLLATFPDTALVERALAATPVVIVQDLFLTETAERADLVLPALPAAMRAGTLVDLDGTCHVLQPARPPDGRGAADFAILGNLLGRVADRLGERRPGVALAHASPEEVRREWLNGAHAGDDGRLAALPVPQARTLWSSPPSPPAAHGPEAHGAEARGRRPSGELRVVLLERLFAGGGTAAFDPLLEGRRVTPYVALHPDDAGRLGVQAGAVVQLRTAYGSVEAPAAPDDRLAPGLVGVPAGVPGSPGGRLVAWYDPHPAVEVRVPASEVAR